MKLRTHIIFSLSLVYSASVLYPPPMPLFIAALLLSYLQQYAIDGLGHARVGGVPRRTALTHSVYSTIISAVLGAGTAYALGYASIQWMGYLAAMLWLSHLGHLLLDLVTEGGVYGFSGRRVKMGGIRYNDPYANMLAVLTAIMLVAASMYIAGYPWGG